MIKVYIKIKCSFNLDKEAKWENNELWSDN